MCCPVVFYLLTMAASAAAAAEGFYLHQDSFADSEALPLSTVFVGWNVPRQAGRVSQAYNWTEAGWTSDDMSYGLLYRLDIRMSYHPDTIDLLHQTKLRENLPVGRHYTLQLKMNQYTARGFRIARRHEFNNFFKLEAGLSLLKSRQLISGDLSGQAMAVAAKDYDFSFDVDYFYSRDALFDRPLRRDPQALGYALDLNLQWRPHPRSWISLEVRDALGYLFWQRAPHTVAQASSEVKSTDDQGYTRFDPVLSGIESFDYYRQPLNRRVLLRWQLQWQDVKLTHQLLHTQDKDYFAYGASHSLAGQRQVHWLVYPAISALEFGYARDRLSMSLSADHWRPRRLRYLTFKLDYLFSL